MEALAPIGRFLLEQVKAIITRYSQPISAQTVQVVTSDLGNDAGLIWSGLWTNAPIKPTRNQLKGERLTSQTKEVLLSFLVDHFKFYIKKEERL